MRNLQKNLHNPPTASHTPENGQMDICVTTGSQEGLCKVSAKTPVATTCFLSFSLSAFFLILGVWDAGQPWWQRSPGCTYLFWHACSGEISLFYTGAQIQADTSSDGLPPPQLQPLGCNLINVPSDHHGMIPSALKDILSRWDPLEVHKPSSTAPKVLYTIPNGGNPTGASMTTERKQEVYKVSLITPCPTYFYCVLIGLFSQLAQQYDMLIIEDDPYYFLQFDKVQKTSPNFSFLSF